MKKIIYSLTLLTLLNSLCQAHSIGQSFILTLPEATDRAALRSWLDQARPAGVMLLASHVQNRTETKKLTAFLQKEAAALGLPPLIIAIDWEGGIVSRPTEMGGFHSIPSPWALRTVGRQACFQAAFLIGVQMRSVGITMNFGPSLDLFSSHILATRCFAANEKDVAECGIAFAKGLIAAGILPVIKHFPGLGSGRGDTHETGVAIAHTNVAKHPDTQPFLRALENDIFAVMATHATCQEFGTSPITRSAKAVNFLRNYNDNALLITDDFCMAAAFADTTQEEALIESLAAGYDLIILSSSPKEQISLIKRLQKTTIPQTRASTRRIQLEPLCTQRIDEKALANQLARNYLQTLYIPPIKQKAVILITTDLRAIRPPEKWFITDGKSYLHQLLKDSGVEIIDEFIINPKHNNPADVTSLSAQQEAMAEAITANPNAMILVQTFFYANGPWNSIHRQLLTTLKPFAMQLCIVSLGHPEEQKIIPDATTIPLGSFHKPLLDNLSQRLTHPIKQGIDAFAKNLDQHLNNKHVGILCNKNSMTNDHRFLPEIIQRWYKREENKGELVALFSPEHGLLINHADGKSVPNANLLGVPVHSLHGKHKKPSPAMLKDIDIMIIDVPDVGMRCYTYLSTMGLMLEACAEQNIPVIVLDKINPIAFWHANGPMLAPDCSSFLGRVPTHFMHGKTVGSIAQMLQKKYKNQLTVIPYAKHSKHAGWYFTPPSPNLMTIDHLYSYPCSVLFEGTNYSEGRGTGYPFLQIGAPWVDAEALATELNNLGLSGIYFEPVSFTPQNMPGTADAPKHENKLCHGVFIHLIDKEHTNPVAIAEALLKTAFRLYPAQSELLAFGIGKSRHWGIDLRYGNKALRKSLMTNKPD